MNNTTAGLYSTVMVVKLKYILAEKLRDVAVATTRGRQQGDPKASGLRSRGVKGLFLSLIHI